jgi:uncharacterized protein YprB with RNaseH-like and TPR domain
MSDFGFNPPPPAEPREPTTLNELRSLIGEVDRMLQLCSKDHRSIYTAKDVQNLLLDIRSGLDRMTSTTVLLGIAVQINDETRLIKDAFARDPETT